MATTTSSNTKLWDSVCETNPDDTKPVNQRGGFTAIDAYSQIHAATVQWGSYGSKWGLVGLSWTFVDTKMAMLQATFKYPGGEFPITNAINYVRGDKTDDDFAKKCETDTITKSLSRLGFNADVFLGRFDDQKYIDSMNEKYTPPYTPEQLEQFHAYLDAGEVVLFHALRLGLPPETWTALFGSFPKGEITRGKSRARTLEAEGWNRVSEYVTHIRTAIEADDQPGLLEVCGEVGELGHSVWGELNEFEKAKIKTVKEAA